MHSQPPNTEALLRRVATFAGGYAFGVYLAARIRVSSWRVEVDLPDRAVLAPGPNTGLGAGGVLAPSRAGLNGTPQHLDHGVVWATVTGTNSAPRVRVYANTDLGSGLVRLADPVISEPASRALSPATPQAWPGSEQNSPGRAGGSAGSGSGGGGGGGGQCELFVDLNNGIVRHKTDAGGGGGAGGGQQHYTGRYA